jgi:superfamily II DNA or RNA helicase
VKYEEFLDTKKHRIQATGKKIDRESVNAKLFEFQKDIVVWAVGRGRCAVFADTGLGKTFIQLEWARIVGGTILIFAPLSVARQTIRESHKIGLEVKYIRNRSEIQTGINITNYENINNFSDSSHYLDGIILDESSILKAIDGQTRRKLIKHFQDVQYRLCCTATPAPNDYTELGNHAEFLGVCSTAEMLSMYFVNANKTSDVVTDSGLVLRKKHSNKNGTQWRMRYHAQKGDGDSPSV